jgi:hypothetical protein
MGVVNVLTQFNLLIFLYETLFTDRERRSEKSFRVLAGSECDIAPGFQIFTD